MLRDTRLRSIKGLWHHSLMFGIPLGCAGMTGFADSLSTRLGIPVIDPIVAATSLALALARMAATG
ncbi:hypothetical protein [Thermostichus vulcanus]|uniref:Uncharacterized protein n=1 Tax=Thermostichus vulcanus str. 'Rupite' TaxID=2813851 RepID=A0ABT0C8K1_THEVL|nr:hypothetical protein [Thermostichus vulcanus]MCJ2542100.1 hypothetical protein [Thermostichus vulcanus str. 'Rupite']